MGIVWQFEQTGHGNSFLPDEKEWCVGKSGHMALSAKLQVRQNQSLTLTPQLMQAIKLLQMSTVELEQFIEEEMNSNPLLARTDEDGPADSADALFFDERDLSEAGAGDNRPAGEDIASMMAAEHGAGPADLDIAPADADPGSEPVSRDPLPARKEAANSSHDQFTPDLEATLMARPGLIAHLDNQIHAVFGDPVKRAVALSLLSHLDPAGYLTVPIDTVAADLGLPDEDVSDVLQDCQLLEPTGVFSRSLAECLALQLAELNRLDPAMQTLLDNLEMVTGGSLAGLKRLCGVGDDDFRDMLEELKALDPKPGLVFGHDPVAVAVADVIVRAAPGGGWIVELNDEVLPRVLVDRTYYARIGDNGSKSDRKFIVDCMQQANWLEKSLDQRARTILKVATEIVAQQDGFLRRGVTGLKPLTLRAVADAVNVHESTVSRATANKYIATPRGLFELKFFFSTAIASTSGSPDHSSEAVKHMIRNLVDGEPAGAVLSDDAIVARLEESGIEIARRTVAKYRDLLRIPSSVQRRRQKRPMMAE